jgi:hypothetical protein
MLKLITSAPAAVFASMIACLSEPAALSFVLMTVRVAPSTGAVSRRNSVRNRNTHKLLTALLWPLIFGETVPSIVF